MLWNIICVPYLKRYQENIGYSVLIIMTSFNKQMTFSKSGIIFIYYSLYLAY